MIYDKYKISKVIQEEKEISRSELISLFNFKSKFDVSDLRKKFFKRNIHYTENGGYKVKEILRDFPFLIDYPKPQNFTLHYIEAYLSRKNVIKIFDIIKKRKAILSSPSCGYRVVGNKKIYDMSKIKENFPIFPEEERRLKNLAEYRSTHREFSPILTERWDRIRRFIGGGDISLIPTDVCPQSFIEKDIDFSKGEESKDYLVKYLSQIIEDVSGGKILIEIGENIRMNNWKNSIKKTIFIEIVYK
jgi:hypothetical protein